MKRQFEENPALAQEQLLTLSEARGRFPVRLSLSAIWRKIRKGSRGVKLETIYLGRRYTSVEAIARYIERTQCGNHQENIVTSKKNCVEQVDHGLRKHGVTQEGD